MWKECSLRELVSVAVVVLGVTAASDSRADTKVFHGSFCVRNGHSSPPAVELNYTTVGVSNITASNKTIICPVVRDNEASTMDVTDWDITVNRVGNMSAWTVRLASASADGGTTHSSTITVPAIDGVQELDGGAITSAFTGGVMYLTSTMPPSVRLARYQITESD